MGDESLIRRSFLFLGIALTLFGCFIAALGIALPAWQVVELAEFNAIHEHGIFYDCIRSETYPLERLRQAETAKLRQHYYKKGQDQKVAHKKGFAQEDSSSSEQQQEKPALVPVSPFSSKKCIYKMDSASSSTWTMRMAIEEGDPAAREMLFHRFLPQHKAVIFFFIFSVVFSLISIMVGSCSACFVPNGILHVISIGMAMSCSILGDVIFFLASMRVDNRNIHGLVHVYYQHLTYAFCVHLFGSATLCAATLCSSIAAYLLLRKEWQQYGCCNSKRNRQKSSKKSKYIPYLSNTQMISSNEPNEVQECTDAYDCSLYSSRYPSFSFYGTQTTNLPIRETGGFVDARLLNLSSHLTKKVQQQECSQSVAERLPPPPPLIGGGINNRNQTGVAKVYKTSSSKMQPAQMKVSLPYTTRAVLATECPFFHCSKNARRRPSAASAVSAPTLEGNFYNKDSSNHTLMATFLNNSKDLEWSLSQQHLSTTTTLPPIVKVEDV